MAPALRMTRFYKEMPTVFFLCRVGFELACEEEFRGACSLSQPSLRILVCVREAQWLLA